MTNGEPGENDMKKITVIIPTYRPHYYLWECLDSIVMQSFPKEDFEVILVLNGCKEPYHSQILSYIEKHSEVQWNYVQTDQCGVSNARNMALDVAKGEYITFIDDDDFVSSSYLQELYEKSSQNTVGVCYPLSFVDGTTNYTQYYITKDYNLYSPCGKVEFSKPRRYFAGPVYKLIHRVIIGDRRFDVRFKNGEDSLFMFLISDRIKYVDFASKEAIYYRRERLNSATANEARIWFSVKNRFRLICAMSQIYFPSMKSYDCSFYRSMIASSLKAIVYEVGRKFLGFKKI